MIPISLRSILILSSHLHLSLPKDLFPVGLPAKILKALLSSSILTTLLAHLNLLDSIILSILEERYKLWSSPLPILISIRPKYLPHDPVANTLSLHFSLNVRYTLRNHIQSGPKVSHPQYFEITSQKFEILILLLDCLKDTGFRDILWFSIFGVGSIVLQHSKISFRKAYSKSMVVYWSIDAHSSFSLANSCSLLPGLGCLNMLLSNLAHKFSITFKSGEFSGQSVQASLYFLRMTLIN